MHLVNTSVQCNKPGPGEGGRGGGGLRGLVFARYVPPASQGPYPVIVYSVANYRPRLSHFQANM